MFIVGFILKMDQNSSQIELITLATEALWAFQLVFGACELGQMVANQFDIFNDKLDQCKWYLFPIDVQRMFVIILANSKQSIEISAFGNVPCTRDTFKKVPIHFIFILQKKFVIPHWFNIGFVYFRRCVQASPISWQFVNSKIKIASANKCSVCDESIWKMKIQITFDCTHYNSKRLHNSHESPRICNNWCQFLFQGFQLRIQLERRLIWISSESRQIER